MRGLGAPYASPARGQAEPVLVTRLVDKLRDSQQVFDRLEGLFDRGAGSPADQLARAQGEIYGLQRDLLLERAARARDAESDLSGPPPCPPQLSPLPTTQHSARHFPGSASPVPVPSVLGDSASSQLLGEIRAREAELARLQKREAAVTADAVSTQLMDELRAREAELARLREDQKREAAAVRAAVVALRRQHSEELDALRGAARTDTATSLAVDAADLRQQLAAKEEALLEAGSTIATLGGQLDAVIAERDQQAKALHAELQSLRDRLDRQSAAAAAAIAAGGLHQVEVAAIKEQCAALQRTAAESAELARLREVALREAAADSEAVRRAATAEVQAMYLQQAEAAERVRAEAAEAVAAAQKERQSCEAGLLEAEARAAAAREEQARERERARAEAAELSAAVQQECAEAAQLDQQRREEAERVAEERRRSAELAALLDKERKQAAEAAEAAAASARAAEVRFADELAAAKLQLHAAAGEAAARAEERAAAEKRLSSAAEEAAASLRDESAKLAAAEADARQLRAAAEEAAARARDDQASLAAAEADIRQLRGSAESDRRLRRDSEEELRAVRERCAVLERELEAERRAAERMRREADDAGAARAAAEALQAELATARAGLSAAVSDRSDARRCDELRALLSASEDALQQSRQAHAEVVAASQLRDAECSALADEVARAQDALSREEAEVLTLREQLREAATDRGRLARAEEDLAAAAERGAESALAVREFESELQRVEAERTGIAAESEELRRRLESERQRCEADSEAVVRTTARADAAEHRVLELEDSITSLREWVHEQVLAGAAGRAEAEAERDAAVRDAELLRTECSSLRADVAKLIAQADDLRGALRRARADRDDGAAGAAAAAAAEAEAASLRQALAATRDEHRRLQGSLKSTEAMRREAEARADHLLSQQHSLEEELAAAVKKADAGAGVHADVDRSKLKQVQESYDRLFAEYAGLQSRASEKREDVSRAVEQAQREWEREGERRRRQDRDSAKREADAARLREEALKAELRALGEREQEMKSRAAGHRAEAEQLRAELGELRASGHGGVSEVSSLAPTPRQPPPLRPPQTDEPRPPSAPTTPLRAQQHDSLRSVGGGCSMLELKVAPSSATVTETRPGGAAHAAGIRKGDTILSVGRRPVTGQADISAAVRGCSEGDKVSVTLVRNRRSIDTEVTVAPSRRGSVCSSAASRARKAELPSSPSVLSAGARATSGFGRSPSDARDPTTPKQSSAPQPLSVVPRASAGSRGRRDSDIPTPPSGAWRDSDHGRDPQPLPVAPRASTGSRTRRESDHPPSDGGRDGPQPLPVAPRASTTRSRRDSQRTQ